MVIYTADAPQVQAEQPVAVRGGSTQHIIVNLNQTAHNDIKSY